MKRYLILIFSVLVVCVAGCRKSDMRTTLVHVPDMKNQACVDHIRAAVARASGKKAEVATVDLEARTVEVAYQSLMLSMKNVEFYVADAGFSANGVPASPKAAAALPPACR